MGLFDKMSYEQAFSLLTSETLSERDQKKAEKVMSEIPMNDPRWRACMLLCLIRRQNAGAAYDAILQEERYGDISDRMLSVLKQPVVFDEFLIAYQSTGSLVAAIYVARAYENGWGTERNHEKAAHLVQEWGEATGKYAEEANKVRKEILSVGKKEPPAAPKTVDTIFGKMLVKDTPAASTPEKTEYRRTDFKNGDVYEGEYVGDTKHGQGKYTWTTGACYDGDWLDGKQTGKGVYHFPSGAFYDGDWVDGKRTGKGVYHYTDGAEYDGDFVDGKFNGKGRLTNTDGSYYEGFFKEDKKHGKGTFTQPSGDRIEAEWVDNMKQGKGVYIFKLSGGRVDKFYKDDKEIDLSTAPSKAEIKRTVFDNGDVYEGEYVDGKKHGQGKYTSAKGWVYEGDFADDTMTGHGKVVFANGGYYEGDFLNGKRNGTGKEKLTDGTIYEGEYQNDKKHGMGKYTFTSGAEYVGITIDGKKEGHGKYTLADGTYFDGEWKDNKKHGHFVYTEKLGEYLQQYEGEFVDDKPDGKHIGFTVGGTSDKQDFHVYENGEFIVGISVTDENRNMTAAELIKQHREYRRKSNAEIGLDEQGYPLPVSSSAPTASVAPVSDDADSEDEWEIFEDIKDLLLRLRMPSLFADPRDCDIANSCEYLAQYIEEAREEFNGGDNAAVNEIIGSIFNITPEDLCNAMYEWDKKISYPSFESYLNSALYSLSFFESEDPDYVLITLANVVYYMWKQDSDNGWFSILCHVWIELGGENDENLLWFKRMRDCGDCNGTADDPIDESNFSEILDRHNYAMGSDCKLYEQAPTAKGNSLYRYEPPEIDEEYKLDKVLAAVFNVGEYVDPDTLTASVFYNWIEGCKTFTFTEMNGKVNSGRVTRGGNFSKRLSALKPLQDYIFNATRAIQRLRESVPADDYNEFKKSLDDYVYLAKDSLENGLIDGAFDWFLQAYNHGYNLRRLGEICGEAVINTLKKDEYWSFNDSLVEIYKIAVLCYPEKYADYFETLIAEHEYPLGFITEVLLNREYY